MNVLRFIIVVAILASARGVHGEDVAGTLLGDKDIRPGLIVDLDCGDGALTLQLAAQPQALVVQGLTASKQSLEKARQTIADKGMYGRVSAEYFAGGHLPYADNLANTLVVQDLPGLEKAGTPIGELLRVVAPFGVVWIERADAKTIGEKLDAANLGGMNVSSQGSWVKVSKPFPSSMDDWPQRGHDAGFSQMSRDQQVGPVQGVRWVSGPYWGGGTPGEHTIVVSGGRLFYVHYEEPAYLIPPEFKSVRRSGIWPQLVAYDAFNGLELWRRPAYYRVGMVADGNVVCLSVPGKTRTLIVIDATTGKTIAQIGNIPMSKGADEPGRLQDLRYADGVFFVPDAGGAFTAWDAHSLKQLWQYAGPPPAPPGFMKLGDTVPDLLVLGQSVYVISADSKTLGSRDVHNGAAHWNMPLKSPTERLMFAEAGMVFTQDTVPEKVKDPLGDHRILRAWNADTGQFLWEYDYQTAGMREIGVYGKLVWLQVNRSDATFVALDAATGKEAKAIRPGGFDMVPWHCFPANLTCNWIISSGTDYLDPFTGQIMRDDRAMRGTCGVGPIPADGLMYQGLDFCRCEHVVRGVVAMSSDAPPTSAATQPFEQRTERGPAFGQPTPGEALASDWPMQRHDESRTGSTTIAVPGDAKLLWSADMPGRATQPVIVAGKLFCAVPDQHLVCALNADTGQLLWQYRTDARVDSSPTWSGGRIYFGSCDGWIYCLSGENGGLVWRFMAAPEDRRIMVRGQIESAWPVHGSLIVRKGSVFAVAGRQTQLDGGLVFYALDSAQGKVIWSSRSGSMPGREFTTDLMISDGGMLYLVNHELEFWDNVSDQVDPATGKLTVLSTGRADKIKWDQGSNAIVWSGLLGFLHQPFYGDQAQDEADRLDWTYRRMIEAQLLCVDGPRAWGFLQKTLTSGAAGRFKEGNWVFSVGAATPWQQQIKPKTVWMKSLVQAGGILVLGSQPNDKPDAGTLTFYDAPTGKILGQQDTPGAPCFDGLSAADGRLFLSCENAKIACYAGARVP